MRYLGDGHPSFWLQTKHIWSLSSAINFADVHAVQCCNSRVLLQACYCTIQLKSKKCFDNTVPFCQQSSLLIFDIISDDNARSYPKTKYLVYYLSTEIRSLSAQVFKIKTMAYRLDRLSRLILVNNFWNRVSFCLTAMQNVLYDKKGNLGHSRNTFSIFSVSFSLAVWLVMIVSFFERWRKWFGIRLLLCLLFFYHISVSEFPCLTMVSDVCFI